MVHDGVQPDTASLLGKSVDQDILEPDARMKQLGLVTTEDPALVVHALMKWALRLGEIRTHVVANHRDQLLPRRSAQGSNPFWDFRGVPVTMIGLEHIWEIQPIGSDRSLIVSLRSPNLFLDAVDRSGH
jgi:hypothetical protein